MAISVAIRMCVLNAVIQLARPWRTAIMAIGWLAYLSVACYRQCYSNAMQKADILVAGRGSARLCSQ